MHVKTSTQEADFFSRILNSVKENYTESVKLIESSMRTSENSQDDRSTGVTGINSL